MQSWSLHNLIYINIDTPQDYWQPAPLQVKPLHEGWEGDPTLILACQMSTASLRFTAITATGTTTTITTPPPSPHPQWVTAFRWISWWHWPPEKRKQGGSVGWQFGFYGFDTSTPLGWNKKCRTLATLPSKQVDKANPNQNLGRLGSVILQLLEVKFSRFLHPSASAFSEATCAVLQAPQASGKRFLVRRGHSLKRCESNGFILECLSSSKHLYVEFSWP